MICIWQREADRSCRTREARITTPMPSYLRQAYIFAQWGIVALTLLAMEYANVSGFFEFTCPKWFYYLSRVFSI
nr:RNA-dependent RNA polymerase [Molussus totiviridae 2]